MARKTKKKRVQRAKKKPARQARKKPVRRKRKPVKSRARRQSTGSFSRAAMKAEVLAHLDSYIKKIPALREKIFKEILRNKGLTQKIAQKIAADLT